ncbi:hypothetical protein LTR53_011329, partial [Teratosphaeriaceae sp. CCFEE 6253]
VGDMMADLEALDAPPPYGLDNTATSAVLEAPPACPGHIDSHGHDTRLYQHAAQLTDTSPESEVERIRSFLLYALSHDYHCGGLAKLSQQDRRHFRALLTRLQDDVRTAAVNLYQTQLPAADDAYLRRHLHAPCRTLDIPVGFATAILRDFFEFEAAGAIYSGCARYLLRQYGGEALAAKVYRDAEWVIPQIAPRLDTREELRDGIKQVAWPYLHSMGGLRNADGPAEDAARVRAVAKGRFELSDRGNACEAAGSEAYGDEDAVGPREMYWVCGPVSGTPVAALPLPPEPEPRHWAARLRDRATGVFRCGEQLDGSAGEV